VSKITNVIHKLSDLQTTLPSYTYPNNPHQVAYRGAVTPRDAKSSHH